MTGRRCGDGYGSTMSPHRLHPLGLASLALVLLTAGCGGSTDQAGADATEPGASAGVEVSPSTSPSATATATASKSAKAKRSASASASTSPSTTPTASVTPPRTLPTTAVPTGKRPDPERPKKGQDFVVELVEKGGKFKGEVNLGEVVIDRSPKDPALADQAAVLLSYSALNTGTKTYRGNDPVGDRFFVRSNDQVMGQQHLYGPDDPNAPGECRTAGKVEWKRGSVLTGCAVLTLPRDAELGGIAFFDGDRKKPRLRVLRYP